MDNNRFLAAIALFLFAAGTVAIAPASGARPTARHSPAKQHVITLPRNLDNHRRLAVLMYEGQFWAAGPESRSQQIVYGPASAGYYLGINAGSGHARSQRAVDRASLSLKHPGKVVQVQFAGYLGPQDPAKYVISIHLRDAHPGEVFRPICHYQLPEQYLKPGTPMGILFYKLPLFGRSDVMKGERSSDRYLSPLYPQYEFDLRFRPEYVHMDPTGLKPGVGPKGTGPLLITGTFQIALEIDVCKVVSAPKGIGWTPPLYADDPLLDW